jgi:hypothetical protein
MYVVVCKVEIIQMTMMKGCPIGGKKLKNSVEAEGKRLSMKFSRMQRLCFVVEVVVVQLAGGSVQGLMGLGLYVP